MTMEIRLGRDGLSAYVHHLLATNLPDSKDLNPWPEALFAQALDRCEYSFSRIERKYYLQKGRVIFDHLNADHMAAFLYFLANTIWREKGSENLPVRLSYLNKIMHGLDIFYSVKMPDIFMLVHPLGTVLGNAAYSDYLVVYQQCTVGAVTDTYPTFGKGTILYSRTSVLGQCHVGDDVVFAANSMIVDTDVPADSVVVGSYPTHRFVKNSLSVRSRCFDPLRMVGETDD
jgi:serine O-acetyltransferase